MKICKRCKQRKALFLFSINKECKSGRTNVCKKCDTLRQRRIRDRAINWKFPYKTMNDPKYIEDRDKLFAEEPGWWWGEGWWNGNHMTPMERQRRYRANKEI